MSTMLLEQSTATPSIEIKETSFSPKEILYKGKTSDSWLSRMILKSYLKSFNLFLKELKQSPHRILEVGSGDGTLLSYLSQSFSEAESFGVEFNADIVALAQENHCDRIKFIELLNTETLPFETGSFDLVISHGFLGRSPIPRHWVKEMIRVSSEALIISSPTPMGCKWLKKLPGVDKAHLLGKPLFTSDVQPVSLNQMKSWVERMGMKAEGAATPLPYGMIFARKPQVLY